ncbi:MFS transporter [Paenibacillus alkalitolerans]|uniref:MFS transporter n=1 Tax=Paenibacillus alkalitolerans TaxID=2799335 RepID=UPI0018F37E72|nr:MFS transporter [Paenibacillus alkalitolerans]
MNYGTADYWRATAALSMGSFLVFTIVYLTQPLLPLLAEEFALSETQASLSVSVVMMCISAALLVYGPLSDAFGRKPLMVLCMAGGTVSTLCTAFVGDYSLMIVLRAVQGLCLAGIPALAMAYMGEEFSEKALSVSMGINIGANTIGGMSGRVLGGVIADHFGWRASFAVIGTLAIVLFALFVWLLPASRAFRPMPVTLRSAGLALLGHVRNPPLLAAMVVGGLHFFVFIGYFNYLTFWLSGEPFRLSASAIGLLFFAYLAGTLGSILSGKLSDRWGKARCVMAGIAIFAAGLLLTLTGLLAFIFAGLVLTCFGAFFSHSASASWVNARAGQAKASATSLYLFSYYLGGSLGSYYLGWFWQHYRWTGVVGGSLLIFMLTMALSLYLYKVERPRTQEKLF